MTPSHVWLMRQMRGHTQAQAVDAINKHVGNSAMRAHTWTQWETGKRRPDPLALFIYCLAVGLNYKQLSELREDVAHDRLVKLLEQG